ncbi:ANT1 [Candida theae]|uniref:Mitochondrial thiamine pyrophosphate carrier 1 n=1 Tax=Candida theae TaxID=1198502 RepID=A0AAD5FXL2_9ASCO|nr:ANT1 [Candida theae]KAI5954703.1 ANT1 [Candida theae]
MSLSPIEKAASGALASAIANTIIYPVDLSKTIIQTQVHTTNGNNKQDVKYKNTLDVLSKIYKEKGVLGWYKGLLSTIVGSFTQNLSFFYWYSVVKKVYENLKKHQPNHKPTTATELALGAIAAAISQCFTMPIGVVTTMQQTDSHHRSLPVLVRDIVNQDGITGLWRGLRVSLVLCINPSITYGSFERLKSIIYPTKLILNPLESFSLGVLAKCLATVATQPLIVAKALLQKAKKPKDHNKNKFGEHEDEEEDIKFDHFTHALAHLWKTEKFRGLYKGIGPQLLKGVFVQGLLFMFKDQIDLLFLYLLALAKRRRIAKA